MSEATATAETTAPAAAPEAAPTEAAPEAQPQVAPEPVDTKQSYREARRGLRQAVTSKGEEPVAPDQPRDEQGRFASEKAPEGDEESGDEPAASAEPVSDDGTPDAETGSKGEAAASEEAPAVPEGHVVLEIPDHHYLRERGRTEFPPIPEEWADEIKGILNDPVRRAQVRDAEGRASDAQTRAVEAKAQAEFWQKKAVRFATDPEFALRVAQIQEQMGAEEAKRYVMGALQQEAAGIAEVQQQAVTQHSEAEIQHQGRVFVELARPRLSEEFPHLDMPAINQLIAAYGMQLEQGVYDMPHWNTLLSFAKGMVPPQPAPEPEPEVETPEQMEARIRAEIEAQQQKRSENPMGSMPAGRTTATPSGPAPAGSDIPRPGGDTKISIRDVRKGLRGR